MERREKEVIVEYVKPQEEKRSNAPGIVGSVLGGTGLGVALLTAAGNSAGNMVSRYLGGNNSPAVFAPAAAPSIDLSIAPVLAGMAMSAYGHGHGHGSHHDCDYVTDKELRLVREITNEKSENAQLRAEKYTDNKIQEVVKEMTERLAITNNKVCNLETHAAVTASGFESYKQFADRIYVHQPKAKMTDCIVTTTNACCCCCSSTPAAPQI